MISSHEGSKTFGSFDLFKDSLTQTSGISNRTHTHTHTCFHNEVIIQSDSSAVEKISEEKDRLLQCSIVLHGD